jgi:hypothetical protein
MLIGMSDARKLGPDLFKKPDRAIGERMLEASPLTFIDAEKIVELMDHFYADPANEYIMIELAVQLCADRFNGKDIEPRLREARSGARGHWEEMVRIIELGKKARDEGTAP